MPLVRFLGLNHDGEYGELELPVDHWAEYPRAEWEPYEGTCAFCLGDPCAEVPAQAKANERERLINEFYRHNPHAETCPVCSGRPT